MLKLARVAATVARGSLRVYWTRAVAAVILGAVGLSVQVPIRSLASASSASRPLIELPAIASTGVAFNATETSLEPSALQANAVSQFYQLLLILGWGALVIAGISILSGFATQAAERAPEVGIRRAAGASKAGLTLGFLGEGTVVLSALLLVGLAGAFVVFNAGGTSWPGLLGGARLLPLTGVLTVTAVVAFGVLAPMRYATAHYLRTQGDGQVSLVIPAFQLAMSLAILLGASALLRKAPAVQGSAGFAADSGVVMLSFDTTVSNEAERAADVAGLLQRLEATPGVAGVSLASAGTLVGLGRVDDVTTDCGMCLRGGILLPFDLHIARHHLVSPGTFQEEGLQLIEGRNFTAADGWTGERVAIVSRHLALSGYQSSGPVGRKLYLGNDYPTRAYRVIGVVEDTRPVAMGGTLEPLDTIYLSVLQHPPMHAEVVVRGAAGDSTLAALAASQAGGPWTTRLIGTPKAVFADAVRPVRWFGNWFAAVGIVVLVAAGVGTLGTMRRWVESCAAEIGARRAVGASRLRVMLWVLGHTGGTGLKGVAAGVVLYFLVLRVSLVNTVGDVPDPGIGLLAGLGSLLVVAAVLGALVPARRMLSRPIASLVG